LVRKKSELTGGDILLLVSCGEIISAKDRAPYGVCLVLHASDLPRGRGWSSHIWELAAGASHITLSLLEAEDKVDSGRIWQKVQIPVPPTALWDEINHLLFTAEMRLMDFALASYGRIQPQEQPKDVEPTYYRQRTPQDSLIDPQQSLADQFDLIRVCDPYRFPAFFEYRGQRFALKLEKLNDE
jgi:methionyl-tRNA formyltransferase